MKHLKEFILKSAQPYQKLLLKKSLLIDIIKKNTGVSLLPKEVKFLKSGIKINTSPVKHSEIFSKKEEISADFKKNLKEEMGQIY